MNDSLVAALKTKLKHYEATYRHPALERFGINEPYALFPRDGEVTSLRWDDEWPSSKRAGVYLIYGDSRLLYVGTAWTLGPRLGCYFQNEDPKSTVRKCKVIHTAWTETPKYVVTIAVPDTSRFEAAALEEYLISELRPCDNTVGRLASAA